MRTFRLLKLFTTVAMALVLCGLPTGCSAPAQGERPHSALKDWPHYGGNQWNERHAELTTINKANVAHLVPRRVMQLGEVGTSLSASPLVVDGMLYVSAADGLVQAFDLRTGMRKWSVIQKLNPELYQASGKPGSGGAREPACCSNTSRGLAYADGTVFLGTRDAKVVALDAATGDKKWEALSVKTEENPDGIYGYNSAPIAIGNMVVIGTTGGEAPTRHHLTAFDQETGKQVWRWYSIPAPDGSDPAAPDGWWGDFVEETAYGQKTTWRDLSLDGEKAGLWRGFSIELPGRPSYPRIKPTTYPCRCTDLRHFEGTDLLPAVAGIPPSFRRWTGVAPSAYRRTVVSALRASSATS